MVENVKVIPGVSLDSDHRLLIADLKVKKVEPMQSNRRRITKTKSLQSKEKRNNYKLNLSERLKNQFQDRAVCWEVLKRVIKKEAEDSLGVKWIGGSMEGSK